MSHWRVVVHALDRTGPPVLAHAFLKWLSRVHPEHTVDVVAVRGGPMIEELSAIGQVEVLLEPNSAGVPPHGAERDRLAERLGQLPDAAATLLVSVAAGQALPLLPRGPVATWSVEAGDDLHWIDGPTDLRDRTSRWLAGSRVTAAELDGRLEPGTPVHLVPEFIDAPPADAAADRTERRSALAADDGDLLVVGAGIATWRKAPDLFLELALAHRRSTSGATTFTWIGGTDDELHPLIRAEGRRLAPDTFHMVGSVIEIEAHLAAADVFAHPARLDSFPLVCLHAAAVGTPVVAFEESKGVREMFGDAFVGASYPDIADLASAVERLRDPGLRAEVATAQQARVLEHFTTDAAAPTVFEHLVAAAHTRPNP